VDCKKKNMNTDKEKGRGTKKARVTKRISESKSRQKAGELVDCLAILVACRRFHGMGAADSPSLRHNIYVRICNISFVDLHMFLFGILGGCTARTHATSFCCSSWYHGFLSP
jgi:hypothetical protein